MARNKKTFKNKKVSLDAAKDDDLKTLMQKSLPAFGVALNRFLSDNTNLIVWLLTVIKFKINCFVRCSLTLFLLNIVVVVMIDLDRATNLSGFEVRTAKDVATESHCPQTASGVNLHTLHHNDNIWALSHNLLFASMLQT